MKYGVVLCVITLLISCTGNKYSRYTSAYQFTALNGEPDYNNLNFWASHPWKQDPADSIPQPLRKQFVADSSVDVFFLHPTTYTEKNKPFGSNAPVDDATLNAKTDYSTILYQASIFNEAGRVFAPRYRQAHLSCYFPKDYSDSADAMAAFNLAYADIKNAFTLYMQQYNNGRPFIIASHSQGTTHAKKLLKELIDGKPLQSKLVAAYLIGIPVEPTFFTDIPVCTDSNKTGCFCSWRTYKNGYKPGYVQKENYVAAVTNPLTGDTTTANIKRATNKGGVLLNFNKVVKQTANAKITDGVLWIQQPRFPWSFLYLTRNYHVGDLNLYYLNTREDVARRIKLFWKK